MPTISLRRGFAYWQWLEGQDDLNFGFVLKRRRCGGNCVRVPRRLRFSIICEEHCHCSFLQSEHESKASKSVCMMNLQFIFARFKRVHWNVLPEMISQEEEDQDF